MRPELEGIARSQPELAHQLDLGWDTPLTQWSASLWADPPEGAFLEAPLREALVDEIARQIPRAEALALVGEVERRGAVLTPHHVCPTDGPTFGATDLIASASAPGPVLVLAWSGVPMSNTAASGALCFSRAQYADLVRPPELAKQQKIAKDRERDGVTERRIALLPPELRDALVYRCPMPARTQEAIASATERLSALVPPPQPGDDYPSWATKVCQAVQRKMLGRPDIYYVDLNRVAADYLARVLQDEAHPVSRLLGLPASALPALGDLSLLYARRPGKRESVETIPCGAAPPDLRDRLRSGDLCPGLVPVFAALRLCSRIRLLGGFRQVNYLETIAEAALAAGVLPEDRGVKGRLVTGRLQGSDGGPLYPLDLALGTAGSEVLPGLDSPMSVLWRPILPRLAA